MFCKFLGWLRQSYVITKHSPSIILCNWWLLRQQTLPCWARRILGSSREIIFREFFRAIDYAELSQMAPKIIPREFFCVSIFFCREGVIGNRSRFAMDASFLLTVEVFLLTVRLFYLRWGNRKQKRPNLISRPRGTVSKKDQTDYPL